LKSLETSRKPSSKEQKAVTKMSKKVSKKNEKSDVEFDLINYGPKKIFKIDTEPNGKVKIFINRESKAYKKWIGHGNGAKFYNVMTYALYKATEKMEAKTSKIVLELFSEALNEESNKLL